jgi:hypothetical protein
MTLPQMIHICFAILVHVFSGVRRRSRLGGALIIYQPTNHREIIGSGRQGLCEGTGHRPRFDPSGGTVRRRVIVRLSSQP